MVLLTAPRTCTGQLIDPFIGQNLLSRIQGWRWAVTEMPNCWESLAGGASPIPLLRHILTPPKGQERSRGARRPKGEQQEKVCGRCLWHSLYGDSPWESCDFRRVAAAGASH